MVGASNDGAIARQTAVCVADYIIFPSDIFIPAPYHHCTFTGKLFQMSAALYLTNFSLIWVLPRLQRQRVTACYHSQCMLVWCIIIIIIIIIMYLFTLYVDI